MKKYYMLVLAFLIGVTQVFGMNIPAAKLDTLKLDLDNAFVELKVANGNEIVIETEQLDETAKNTAKLITKNEGNTLVVSQSEDDGNGVVKYTISVPANVKVNNVSLNSGNVYVDPDLLGANFEVYVAYGDIYMNGKLKQNGMLRVPHGNVNVSDELGYKFDSSYGNENEGELVVDENKAVIEGNIKKIVEDENV